MSQKSSKLLAAALITGAAAIAVAVGINALPHSNAVSNAASAQPSAKLDRLSPEKKAFINDPKQLARFELTREKVDIAIAGFDDAAVDTYVTALMTAVASAAYKDGDFTETPLNKNFARFNAGMTLRPAILDTYPRDPGPFSLDRYVNQKGGIPTFAKAPVAIRKEDLVAGKVEVAFVGIPLDLSSGYRDAKHGPAFLRVMTGLTGTDPDTGINPNVALRLADYGNFTVDNMAGERTITHARERLAEIQSAGAIPFVVGGDHSVMYADVAAAVDQHGKGKVNLVLVDAHAEMGSDAHTISDQQSLRRLIQDGIVAPGNVVIVAVRDPDLSPEERQQLERQGVKLYPMSEIRRVGWSKALDSVAKDARRGSDKTAISFDISALDPAYAGAAGRPVPGGLTVIEAKDLARTLCAATNVVSFDMLDVAPVVDPTYQTTMNANSVMHSCLTGIAQRKAKR